MNKQKGLERYNVVFSTTGEYYVYDALRAHIYQMNAENLIRIIGLQSYLISFVYNTYIYKKPLIKNLENSNIYGTHINLKNYTDIQRVSLLNYRKHRTHWKDVII